MQNEYFADASEIGSGKWSRVLVLTRRISASGVENLDVTQGSGQLVTENISSSRNFGSLGGRRIKTTGTCGITKR